MPGATPAAAVSAFLTPLEVALACVAHAKFTLTPGARGEVGRTHSWTLNGDQAVQLGDVSLRATMQFECQDTGESRRDQRYRVSTRGYMYGISGAAGEIFSAHWHPNSQVSSFKAPHYHLGDVALSDEGVYLARAHIPSGRVSFEEIIRMLLEQFGVQPLCDDWSDRLDRTEKDFIDHRHWE